MWAIETSWWICLSKKVIIKTRDHPIHTHIAIKIGKDCIVKNIGTFFETDNQKPLATHQTFGRKIANLVH